MAKISANVKPTTMPKITPELVFSNLKKLIKLIGKVFAGAIILVFLASLAPELREQIPSFYRFVDLLMKCLEEIYKWFWLVVDKF
ncbi:MAG: hypothetical protein ACI4UE_03960 [Candidatus Scatovivens sp.]